MTDPTDRFSLADALANFDSASGTHARAVSASALAEVVRVFLDEDDPDIVEDDVGYVDYGTTYQRVRPANATSRLGLSVIEKRPFVYDNVTYNTAMNAFQAQKATAANRAAFGPIHWVDAVRLGRDCTIDVAAWDKDRVPLMEKILTAQAKQHDGFARIIAEHGNETLCEDTMVDAFWAAALPGIWASIATKLRAAIGAEDEIKEVEKNDAADSSGNSCKKRLRYA